MSDAGGEYKSKAFDKMLKDRGIKNLQSIPYAHQKNGRAECIIRTLMEKAESMRLQASLPQSWWEFSVEHAAHVYNQTPLCCLDWQTPYQLLNNERPSVEYLWVLSCLALFIPFHYPSLNSTFEVFPYTHSFSPFNTLLRSTLHRHHDYLSMP